MIPDPALERLLIDNGVEISAEPVQEGGNSWLSLLLSFAPELLVIGFYVWIYRRAQQQGGGMNRKGQGTLVTDLGKKW